MGMIQGLSDSVSARGLDAVQVTSLVGSLPALQKKALAFLMRNGPTQPIRVCEAMGMGDDTASVTLNSLVKVGVVQLTNGYAVIPEPLQKILNKTSVLRGYGY